MDLATAVSAAHRDILAQPAPAGRVDVLITGRADGSLCVGTYRPGFGGTPDISIEYCGDSYTLTASGVAISGALHTLSRVLYTRLCRRAALNPAN